MTFANFPDPFRTAFFSSLQRPRMRSKSKTRKQLPVKYQPVKVLNPNPQTSRRIYGTRKFKFTRRSGRSFSQKHRRRYLTVERAMLTNQILRGHCRPIHLNVSLQFQEKKGEVAEAEPPNETSAEAPDSSPSYGRNGGGAEEGVGLAAEQPFIKLSQEEYGEHHSSIMHCR